MENSEENKSEEKKSYFIHWLLGGAVSVFIGVTLLFFYINKWTLPIVNDENNTLSNLGTIGDYFGGLINPLLGFVSFCALLYTILIQREELKRSIKVQTESAKTFKQQRFETTFFSLLNHITQSITLLENKHYVNQVKGFNNENNRIVEDVKRHSERIFNNSGDNEANLSKIQNELYRYDSDVSKLSILIYQALKFIDTECSNDNPKKYSNILRAYLNSNWLFILAINCCRTDLESMGKYKLLIEKYAMLEHMPFKFYNSEHESQLLIFIYSKYNPIAFGESDYVKVLKSKNIL